MKTIKNQLGYYLLRLAWLVLALLVVATSLAAIQHAYQEYTRPETHLPLRELGLPTPLAASLSIATSMLSGIASIGLAVLLFVRLLPRDRVYDRMAMFTSFMLLTFGLVLNSTMISLPDDSRAWVIILSLVGFLGAILFVLFMLIFPDGRYVPRWAVWLPRLFLAWFATWFFWPQLGPLNMPDALINIIVITWMVAALAMQVYRYLRVSNAVERQQTKWVAYSLLVLMGLETVGTLSALLAPEWDPVISRPLLGVLLKLFSDFIWLIFPLSIAIAILRYRLWEIDRLINKTLVYSILTLVLGGIYFGSVLGLRSLLFGGADSGAAVVMSTLVVAGLFNPLRGGIQAIIDRRFYRSRYDAERILATFAEMARSEVSLDRLGEQLTAVVEDTLQPEVVSLWLVGGGRHSKRDEAAWRMLLEMDE